MNFDVGNDNDVVLLKSEHLNARSSKVKSTKSACDARLPTIVEINNRTDKERNEWNMKKDPRTKVLTKSEHTKHLLPKLQIVLSIADELAAEHHNVESRLNSTSQNSESVMSSGSFAMDDASMDELAAEHHISEPRLHSTSQNSGSAQSSGSFAMDDYSMDPSSGSFHCDYPEIQMDASTKNNLPIIDMVANVNNHEPTLEDLMSILEFEDVPDFIEDAPYNERFHMQLSTPSVSLTSKRDRSKTFQESSTEFFPNSSIELAKADINDDEILSGGGSKRHHNKSSGNGNQQLTERKRKMSEVLEVQDEKCTPNRPHPALEFPLLYFLLRRCQWLFDKVKIPYAYRWKLSYPLQRSVPFGPELEKMGIHSTWGELLLLLPFFASIVVCMMYTVVAPSVSTTGKIARFGLISSFVFAQKNSLVTLLLGMPCDRAMYYHKLSGRVAGFASALHAVSFFIDPKFRRIHQNDFCSGALIGTVNISGSVMMIIIVAICVSAMSRIRRRWYELFYYLHNIFTTGLIIGAFFHSGYGVPIAAAATWGVDLFIRSIVMARTRYPRKATLKLVSDTVIELTFPKTTAFAYNPGQYVHIAIPEISWLQWHPFSISSSPKQRAVTLHIRKAGNWTKALFDLCQKQKEVSILLEGPYGNLSVDLMNDQKYKNVMLISGGIGITPMQSICEQLLYEKVKKRRTMHNLKFIWIERDPQLMQESTFVKRTSSIGSIGSLDNDDLFSLGGSKSFDIDDFVIEEGPIDFDASLEFFESTLNDDVKMNRILDGEACVDIIGQLLSVLPPSRTTDNELEAMYQSGEFDYCGEGQDSGAMHNSRQLDFSEINTVVKQKRRPSFIVEEETSFAENDHCWLTEASKAHNDDRTVVSEVFGDLMQALDMQIYLTNKQQLPISVAEQIPHARFGRPDMKKIFLEMKQAAIDSGDRYVAVCVSAPKALTEKCRQACQRYSDKRVQFDFHTEVMAY